MQFAFPAYKNEYDFTVKINDLFIVSFNDSVSESTIDSLYDDFQTEQIEGPLPYTGTRAVTITSQEFGNTLEVANIFYETGLVKYSQPAMGGPVLSDY